MTFRINRAVLKELLDNQELVNGTILTEDGGVFKVHLEVLAGLSPYIKRILFAARGKPWESILLPGTSRSVFANIINYMYTGQLSLSLDKVNGLIKTAEFLEMPDVIRLCRDYLLSILNNENCIIIYTFAKKARYDDVIEAAKSRLMIHFQEIFPVSHDFLNLDVDDLMIILSNDLLNVKGEEYVFQAIMRWVENNQDNRLVYLPSLLRCVRFGLINQQFYESTIWPNPLLSSSEECQAIILQASQVFADMPLQVDSSGRSTSSFMLDIRHPFLRPRIPHEIIFAMGGWSAGSATNVIETFDVRSGRWFLSLFNDTVPRAYHGMLWHKGHVYVIGGFDGNQCFNTVRRYDPICAIWEEKGCMFEQRCYVSVAAVGNYIYAMGGYDGHRRNKSCERYDLETNQWTMMANMNHVRSDASADSLNGKVYIAGGFNGQQVLNSAECYDPVTNEWTPITTMSSPRSGVKLVAFCDQLYMIGGFNGNSRLSTVEKFDPRTKIWAAVSPMNGPRSNFAAAVLEGYLYVIGGFNGLSTIAKVERFDHNRNEWTIVTDMNLNRSALSACTVSGIPNAHQFTFIGNVP